MELNTRVHVRMRRLYEQGEILDYPQVFYVGANAQKQVQQYTHILNC